MANFFSLHTHSEFSAIDGMSPVRQLVTKAERLKYPGLGLTDHGNMSGAFQLYTECRKHDLIPFPGIEAYVVHDANDKDAPRFHMCLLALDSYGYQVLAAMSTASHHPDNYHYKPRMDYDLFAGMSGDGVTKHLAATTGCYFGPIQQAIANGSHTEALVLTKMLAKWFPNLIVELQHHGKDDDDEMVEALWQIASEVGLPVITTQDSHYCDRSQKELHNLMKQMAYKATDPGDVEFPGDSYHLASGQWVYNHYDETVVAYAEDTFKWLLESNKVKIPGLDKYTYHVPSVVPDPATEIKEFCKAELILRGLDGKPRYETRLRYELDVINGLGFADYLLLVQDYVRWARQQGILVNARGSASGSLVCWLLGITNVDPVKWGLSFDRFLTPDRERPPDIDIDVEDVRRDEVIQYLKGKYEIAHIGTYNRFGYDEETERGSLFVHYLAAKRKQLGDVEYKRIYGHVKTMAELRPIVGAKIVQQISELGRMTIRSSPGIHAAGLVLSAPGHHIEDWLPLMYIPSSKKSATQMMMEDVENAGYIKIDLLGLRSLHTLHRIMDLTGITDLDSIPLRDSATATFLSRGIPDSGIFQMEGWTAARGCREVRVQSVHDVILVNALYRPATIDAGHVRTYIRNRSAPKRIKYLNPLFERLLKDTYGVPVYQEQIIEILRAIGTPVIELNKMLKAIKASNDKVANAAETFRDMHDKFTLLGQSSQGWTKDEAEQAWNYVATFSGYSFNRAHATAYGLLGWQLAWFKVHYPNEFHAALLETTAGSVKEAKYIKETRRVGIKLLPADVNRSGASWKLDRRGIRRGLVSIKGIGWKAAEEIAANQPYADINDLIARTNARIVTGGKTFAKDGQLNGVLLKLLTAGALRSLE